MSQAFVEQASPLKEAAKQQILESPIVHYDETGICVAGKLLEVIFFRLSRHHMHCVGDIGQTKGRNLLDRLTTYRDEVLVYAIYFSYDVMDV
ncbi:hypothetical protein TI03_06430 [Achromatium sp. WMS1]|nr:hypothetical protein TI03_06430 [Achromatium sp. WMS1]